MDGLISIVGFGWSIKFWVKSPNICGKKVINDNVNLLLSSKLALIPGPAVAKRRALGLMRGNFSDLNLKHAGNKRFRFSGKLGYFDFMEIIRVGGIQNNLRVKQTNYHFITGERCEKLNFIDASHVNA